MGVVRWRLWPWEGQENCLGAYRAGDGMAVWARRVGSEAAPEPSTAG